MNHEPEELCLCAHEAGHAVVAAAIGLPVFAAQVFADGAGECVTPVARKPTYKQLLKRLFSLLGGETAEQLLVPDDVRRRVVPGLKWTDWGSDGREIDATLNAIVAITGENCWDVLEGARELTRAILLENWAALVATRDALLAGNVVDSSSKCLRMVKPFVYREPDPAMVN